MKDDELAGGEFHILKDALAGPNRYTTQIAAFTGQSTLDTSASTYNLIYSQRASNLLFSRSPSGPKVAELFP